MEEARFHEGDSVTILTLAGIDAAADRRLVPYVGTAEVVIKTWCLTRDEMPDLVKMVVYPDVWCCDVRLDESGETVRGVPEAALERRPPCRS